MIYKIQRVSPYVGYEGDTYWINVESFEDKHLAEQELKLLLNNFPHSRFRLIAS